MFSKALLAATYENGKVGKLTTEHEKAEYHRFKKEYLFKDKKIPRDVYASRLIQHFLIIQAIETKLKSLSGTARSEISAFFTISYLEQLWRTPAIERDLQQLEVNPAVIHKGSVAKSTQNYLKTLEKLPPRSLLAHFLLHIAGFMHGGSVISNYIRQSNCLTTYTIPANQYDFSLCLSPSNSSVLATYRNMMKQVDNIIVSEDEYEEILQQCKSIYATMTNIYDDLCKMHDHQLQRTVAVLGISLVILLYIIGIIADYLCSMEINATPGVGLG